MTEPAKFVFITRTINQQTGVHYVDAIDDKGQHWMAQMSHGVEPWLCYTKTWYKDPQKAYD